MNANGHGWMKVEYFCQTVAEELWDNKYPAWGKAYITADYMKLPKDQLEPIMTNSENINQFFTNQYIKTATALHVLRETIMGRELFDYAFKEYAKRWAFKHPTPADFFRTWKMQAVKILIGSGVDGFMALMLLIFQLIQ